MTARHCGTNAANTYLFPWEYPQTLSLRTLLITTHPSTLQTTLWGNFIVVGGISYVAYVAIWPLETIKNLAQSGTPHPRATTAERIAYLGGVRGLMRGVGPGALAGGVRNGLGMIAMVYAQKWATILGLRD
jgi:hypothetical protein